MGAVDLFEVEPQLRRGVERSGDSCGQVRGDLDLRIEDVRDNLHRLTRQLRESRNGPATRSEFICQVLARRKHLCCHKL